MTGWRRRKASPIGCRPRPSGSTRAGPEPPPPTPRAKRSRRRRPISAGRRTARGDSTGRLPWGATRPTRGASSTCTATSPSGAATGTGPTTPTSSPTQWAGPTAGPASCAAGASSAPRTSSARFATAARPIARASSPTTLNRLTGFRVVRRGAAHDQATAGRAVAGHQQNVKQGPAPEEGPDPSKPYFADLSKGLTVPKDAWGPIYGAWNHYGTIAVCPNGDVLAVWYTCTQEEGRETAQAACRLRAGSDKWDPPSFFFGTPDCNTHAPVLLREGKRLLPLLHPVVQRLGRRGRRHAHVRRQRRHLVKAADHPDTRRPPAHEPAVFGVRGQRRQAGAGRGRRLRASRRAA